MLRYVKTNIPGKIAYVDDDAVSYEHGEEILSEFLSLGRGGLFTSHAPGDIKAFAKAHGSLTEPAADVAVPAHARSFLSELGDKVALEDEGMWRYHIDAMRDIAVLHSLACWDKYRRRVTGVRVLMDNCIVYEAEDGSTWCLYHGTNGSLGALSRPEGIPSDVEAYLKAIGAGFTFTSPYSGEPGDLDGLAWWMASNADAISALYLSRYLRRQRAEGCLLALLQDKLQLLVRGERPLSFCVMCGSVISDAVQEYSQSFDGNSCRTFYYRCRGELIESLSTEGGYSASDAADILENKRGPYKLKA